MRLHRAIQIEKAMEICKANKQKLELRTQKFSDEKILDVVIQLSRNNGIDRPTRITFDDITITRSMRAMKELDYQSDKSIKSKTKNHQAHGKEYQFNQ